MACEATDHERHMCMLVAKRTSVEELKRLVKDAKYICRNCGRAVADPTNVCAPEEI